VSLAYYLVVTVHVLAALLWLGGMFFLGIVGAPVLRTIEPAALRQQLFHSLGLRFRKVGWWSIAILVATGVAVLHIRGLLRWDAVLANPAFWRTPTGIAFAVKLAAVIVIVSLSAVHDFSMGPAAGRAVAGTAEAQRLRRRAAMLARVNGMLALVLVIAAVRLARGG
jgi:copper resistance protein D